MCIDDLGSAFTDVSTEITGMRGSTCQYIPTKVMGVQKVTPTDDSIVKMVKRGRTNTYDQYWR